MTVFRRERMALLQVHVPKTGGRSILNLLQHNGFSVDFCDVSSITTGFNALRTCSPQHYHADLLRQTLRLDRLDYVFTTVRHPISRLKSEFLWRVRDPAVDPNAWVAATLDAYADDPFLLDNHIRPQHEFLLDGCDIFHAETDVAEALAIRLEQRLGLALTAPPEGRLNVASSFCGRTIADVSLDSATRARVVAFYALDFQRLGYDPDHDGGAA